MSLRESLLDPNDRLPKESKEQVKQRTAAGSDSPYGMILITLKFTPNDSAAAAFMADLAAAESETKPIAAVVKDSDAAKDLAGAGAGLDLGLDIAGAADDATATTSTWLAERGHDDAVA